MSAAEKEQKDVGKPAGGTLHKPKQFDCFVLGDDLVTMECCEILLSRGHNVQGIVTADARVARWAADHGIRHCPYAAVDGSADEALALLTSAASDYVFSIVNLHILPSAVLRIPRHYVINYHNGPLPRYAGLDVTSWALINGEQTHGITWHIVREGIDTGEILKQVLFPVESDETALSLNIKCSEAAVNTFAELIDELATSSVVTTPQDLSARTYFGASRRPAAACNLFWEAPAPKIDSLVRALNFGPTINHLGRPKFAFGETFFWISRAEVLDRRSQVPPGTVTAIDHEHLSVASADYEVRLHGIHTVDGQPLPVDALVETYGLGVSQQLDTITDVQAHHITRYDALLNTHEPYWLKRLERLTPLSTGYGEHRQERSRVQQLAVVPLQLSDGVAKLIASQNPPWRRDESLAAAFLVFIARTSGSYQFDVGFRHPALRRELAGWGMEALFASHVPLAVALNDQGNLAQAVQDVREQTSTAIKHKTYARDMLSRYPTLSQQYTGRQPPQLPILLEFVDNPTDGEQYQVPHGCELALVVLADEALEESQPWAWMYSEVFDAATLTSIVGHFQALLEGVVANPRQRMWALPLLPETERQLLLVDWNDTQADYAKNVCIHHLFEHQVERNPQATAVAHRDQHLTYAELNHRTNQLAHHLQALGVGPGTLVGICLERSPDLLVGLLAILKAGGAYVPLDPTFPKERLAFIMQDAQVSVLLTQQLLTPALPDHHAPTICLDTDWSTIARQDHKNPVTGPRPTDLAYVIHTSGSTGRPKGVQIPHQAVVNFLGDMRRQPGLSQQDSLLAVTTISFDIAALELFLPLSVGGKVVLADRETVSDPLLLAVTMTQSAATVMQATPATWRMLLDSGWPGDAQLAVLCGGEALPRPLADQLLSKSAVVWNLYGPTETTVWSAAKQVEPGDGPIPIGRPISNTQIYLLDANLQPVPTGVFGELYIGGDGLAWGYLRRPGLTAEKFVPNPFSPQPGARLYHTGDLARYLPHGDIEFFGRTDHQVKIRGFRIELGEIEAILSQHPQVREVVVLVREDLPGDRRLVAYLVPDGEAPTPAELRGFLKEKLPDYMVPSAYLFLDQLPLTPNRKVDRRRLPAPDSSNLLPEETHVSPRTPVEEALASIWGQVLNATRVGVEDNFFELGGHSLLATQVITCVLDEFQVQLPLLTLFESPTVAGMAAFIEGQQTKALEDDRLGQLLAELEDLSDEEARRLLSEAGD